MNLRIGSLPQGFAGYLLAGTRLGSISNIPGSMGTLCLGGNFAKFKNQAAPPNAAGQVEVPIDMTQIPTYPLLHDSSGPNMALPVLVPRHPRLANLKLFNRRAGLV
ncbi:MAG: hypothetical protein ACI9X4_000351 [Glaciecola sp.]